MEISRKTPAREPEPLDPAFVLCLDWPLYFPDEPVSCNNYPAWQHPDCRTPCWGPVSLASARRITIREFLADIKEHAEGDP